MYDPLPRVYEMAWRGENRSLELRINSQVVGEIFSDPKVEDWAIAKHVQQKYKLGKLTADPDIGFGFDPCRLMRRGSHLDFAVFSLHLPQIEVGKGKSRQYRHQLGTVATINLSLLLSRLLFPELQRIETKGHQLMTIELSVADRSMHAYPLWGAFSPEMVKWIGSHQQQTDLPLVRSAMKEAYVQMLPSFRSGYEFQAWLKPEGVFNLRVPGDCACLSPDYTAQECLQQNCGYDFGSHNVDAPAQQLTLLVGLVYMWEMARESLRQLYEL